MAGSCECGNEPSGSIKCGEFVGVAEDLLASQGGLCSKELVSYVRVCREESSKTAEVSVGVCLSMSIHQLETCPVKLDHDVKHKKEDFSLSTPWRHLGEVQL